MVYLSENLGGANFAHSINSKHCIINCSLYTAKVPFPAHFRVSTTLADQIAKGRSQNYG